MWWRRRLHAGIQFSRAAFPLHNLGIHGEFVCLRNTFGSFPCMRVPRFWPSFSVSILLSREKGSFRVLFNLGFCWWQRFHSGSLTSERERERRGPTSGSGPFWRRDGLGPQRGRERLSSPPALTLLWQIENACKVFFLHAIQQASRCSVDTVVATYRSTQITHSLTGNSTILQEKFCGLLHSSLLQLKGYLSKVR